MSLTDLDRLLAIEAIRALKARYFRCVDTKDWDGFTALLADDVHFDAADSVLHSAAAATAMASAGLTDCVSVHHGYTAEIVVTSATTADGIWAMEDLLRWNAGAASPIRTLHGYGHYHETYRRIDGTWRIQTLKLVRLRVDTTGWEALA